MSGKNLEAALSHRIDRRKLIGTAAATAGALSLVRPSLSAAQDPVELTWGTWGNTGEIQRFQEYTDSFNAANPGIRMELIPSPNDGYDERLLTQLNGGSAPDLFYVGDGIISQLVKNNAVLDITDMLSGPNSMSKPEQFAGDLWGASVSPEGRYFGTTVDCNPLVLWYNRGLLREVGVTTMPADLYEAGQWNWQAFQAMCDQIRAAGRTPYVLPDWWAGRYGWTSSNAGKVYDAGQYVAHQDPKSVEAFQFIADNLASENFVYAGGLPEGQGDTVQMMSGQLGFISVGRWGLPLFKENPALDVDIVPNPTNTGNKLEPGPVAVAYISINAATEHPEEAFTYLTNFVSPAGQQFRLQGGGNAVPSIQGVEEVVLEGGLPEHAQYFIDARAGFAAYREEVGTPGLSTAIDDRMETFFLDGGDVQATLNEIAEMANTAIANGGV
ncbi:MAG: ABC transporter, substrate-binding protein (cluster 1, maltose/g3p/polyamine/iron) [uncultured Thermomicrobiales bacterium]|uniref:ABC transporter, substrate-binding protein (Cluster 1, maltose/g3p/polyamine/iron) n=1 Tax=uncultured Thermomicrobiales bacterium TaxID=1645740 RepID=A0A6J4U5X1_9BACT|nr:MAG: ABC transporter, substrate-binding protein (cluster 1, maltose/g3p/polyamine/iron) [uncultured Thermomicrobiales bacterium]